MQTLVIPGWHPTSSANRSHDHWRKIQRAHHADRDRAWACALQAGWKEVPGKVLLTITLVYPRKYRVDADNLAARCKGLIDGLKSDYRNNHGRLGWFADDDSEHLDLKVTAVVERGVKETRIRLEPAPITASDYDRIYGTEESRDTSADLKPKSGVLPNRPVVSGIPIDTGKD